MITIINRQRTFTVNEKKMRQVIGCMLKALDYQDFDIGVWFSTNATIRKFNHQYRGKDKATDILSFPYHTQLVAGKRIVVKQEEDKNLGDIIISLAYVNAKAPEWDRSFEQHLIALLAHGIAHLLNYDHQTDQEYSVMQKVEKKLLRAANIR